MGNNECLEPDVAGPGSRCSPSTGGHGNNSKPVLRIVARASIEGHIEPLDVISCLRLPSQGYVLRPWVGFLDDEDAPFRPWLPRVTQALTMIQEFPKVSA